MMVGVDLEVQYSAVSVFSCILVMVWLTEF